MVRPPVIGLTHDALCRLGGYGPLLDITWDIGARHDLSISVRLSGDPRSADRQLRDCLASAARWALAWHGIVAHVNVGLGDIRLVPIDPHVSCRSMRFAPGMDHTSLRQELANIINRTLEERIHA